MTKLARAWIGLLALALAACDGGGPTSEAKPTGAPHTEAPSPEPPLTPGPDATRPPEQNVIPAAFQGVWAARPADCAKPAETRLEIGADRLSFYESSGPVASVDASDPSEILITIALSGEGALSRRTFRYRLIDDGQGLLDVRNGLRRIRCATP